MGVHTASPTRRLRHGRGPRAFALTLGSAALIMLAPPGCQKPQSAGSAAVGGEPYINAYTSGRYAEAFNEAERAAGAATGPQRDRAAIMAGLSAHALRQPDTAERWLIPLQEHPDPEIAGTAQWTLGEIAQDRGNHVKAVGLLTGAAAKLPPDDAGRAWQSAAESSQRLGRTADARAQLQQGLERAQAEWLKQSLRTRLNTLGAGPATTLASTGVAGGAPSAGPPVVGSPIPPPGMRFVIQLGAFSQPAAADDLARRTRPAAAQAGQPAPAVTTTTEPRSGKTLYAVRVGSFSTRPAAEEILRRMGVRGTVMAVRR